MLLFCLFTAFVASGQVPEVVKYTLKDGLVTTAYNFHLLEDSRGFLWGATPAGVFRYDGHQFEHFTNYDEIPDRLALRFIEDPHNKIWVQTYSGVLAHWEGDAFEPYEYNDTIDHLTSRDNNWHFQVDRQGSLYLGTSRSGLWKVDSTGMLSNPIPIKKEWKGLAIWFSDSLPPIPFGLRVDTTTKALPLPEVLNLYDKEFRHVKAIELDLPRKIYAYRPFFTQCKDGTTVLGFGHHLYRISLQEGIMEQNIQPSRINSVCEDRDGNLWVATIDSGVVCFPGGRLDAGKEVRYFSGTTFNWVMQDREGGIWLTAKDQGIWYMPDPVIQKGKLPSNTASVNGAAFSGALTDDFLYFLNEDNDILRLEYDGNDRMHNLTSLSLPFPGLIRSLGWEPHEKRLYVAHSTGVAYLDSSGAVHRVLLPDSLMERDITMRIFPSEKEGVWVLNHHSAFKLENDSVSKVIHTYGNKNNVITESLQGERYWLGGEEGIWYHHGDTTVFMADRHPMFKGRIHALAFHRGLLWVIHSQFGLGVFKGDSLIKHWPPETRPGAQGLTIEGDTIWVAGVHDLNKYVYYAPDSISLQKRRVNFDDDAHVGMFYINKNHFWVFSNSGLIHFRRQDISRSPSPPPVYITNLSIDEQDTSVLPFYMLDHTQNYLRITYTGISFQTPQMQFKYRMKGVDERWQYSDQRTVQYTRLSPGQYVFEVYARGKNGVWSTRPATFGFEIQPPFWATWWFRTLMVLAFISLIAGGFQLRYRRLNARREIERQLIRLESKALRAQINPHFIFNVLNAIQDYVARGDTTASEIYLVKFSRLIRLILENSRESFVKLSRELETLEHYLDMERMRFKDHFSYTIHLEPGIDPETLYLPPMLIQPFVENAIKHGLSTKEGDGQVTLTFIRENSDSLRCEITDNGIGWQESPSRKNTNDHQPLGMLITRERLQLLNRSFSEQLEVEITGLKTNGMGSGTRVTIHVPVSEGHNISTKYASTDH